MVSENLKLSATSDEDLRVISAHLQDSITQIANIAHLKKNKIFLIQFNRFMWEDVEKGVFRKNRRIQSIFKLENVLSVYSKNLNQKKKNRFLDFLAIESKQFFDKNYEITGSAICSGINNSIPSLAENVLVNMSLASFSICSRIGFP